MEQEQQTFQLRQRVKNRHGEKGVVRSVQVLLDDTLLYGVLIETTGESELDMYHAADIRADDTAPALG